MLTGKKSPKGQLRASGRATANIRKLPQDTWILLHAFGVCKAGGMPTLLLRKIQCRWCDVIFCICRQCWRGQAYCCDQCRLAAKRKKHCEAQRKYRRTKKGKKSHRLDENRRRHGQNQNKQKNMDDAASPPPRRWAMRLLTRLKKRTWQLPLGSICHFCGAGGQIVDAFPRRGYG